MLWDADKKIVPSGAGHMFIVEKTDGRSMAALGHERGPARLGVCRAPWSRSPRPRRSLPSRSRPNPKSAFAFLMRGVVRYENDDLDHAVADLDEALKIDPKYVPALIERAYLWQWRNQP